MTTHFDNALTHRVAYNAYLVRLWQDTPDSSWRASAQSVQNGEVVHFGSLHALFTYLETQTRIAEDGEIQACKGDEF